MVEIVEKGCRFGIAGFGHEDGLGHVKGEEVFIDAIRKTFNQRFEQRDLWDGELTDKLSLIVSLQR